jgi:hypothetical protein
LSLFAPQEIISIGTKKINITIGPCISLKAYMFRGY